MTTFLVPRTAPATASFRDSNSFSSRTSPPTGLWRQYARAGEVLALAPTHRVVAKREAAHRHCRKTGASPAEKYGSSPRVPSLISHHAGALPTPRDCVFSGPQIGAVARSIVDLPACPETCMRGQAEQLRCVNRSEILRHLNRSYENATSSLHAPEFASSCRCSANRRPRDIPELTVIVGECRLPGSRDSGRRRLTRFPNVARGLTFRRCVAAAFPETVERD